MHAVLQNGEMAWELRKKFDHEARQPKKAVERILNWNCNAQADKE